MTRIRRNKVPAKKRKLLADGSVPESVIQAQILYWLSKTNLLWWRQNAGEMFVGYRKVSLGPVGISDVVVIVPPNGRFLGLEVKSAKGTLRPAQKAFRDRLEASGGMFQVVRTLDQAQKAVAKAIGEEVWKQRQESNSRTETAPQPSSLS